MGDNILFKEGELVIDENLALHLMDMNYPSEGDCKKEITYSSGEISIVTYKKGTTVLATATYAYDGNNNIDYITLAIGSNTYTKAYTYDGNQDVTDVTITKS